MLPHQALCGLAAAWQLLAVAGAAAEAELLELVSLQTAGATSAPVAAAAGVAQSMVSCLLLLLHCQ
jgi:hypothetical protein